MGKKMRMSRGLDDLFGDNITEVAQPETSGTNETVSTMNISLIEPNKSQPRTKFDDEKLSELADSIKENGILQPILVKPLSNGGYQIVAGERRWRAARLAGLKEVPVFIRELTEKQTMQLALIENIQRQDLSPVEESKAYKQLMDTYNMTQQEISQVVGKSRSVIANSLRLLSLCEPVIKMLESGELTVGHGKMLAGIEDTSLQQECAEKCVSEDFTVRQLESYVNQLAGKKKSESKKIKDNSFKQENPFLREFEINVNNNSNIKTKVRPCGNGATSINLTIAKDINSQEVLSQLAQLLTKY